VRVRFSSQIKDTSGVNQRLFSNICPSMVYCRQPKKQKVKDTVSFENEAAAAADVTVDGASRDGSIMSEDSDSDNDG
jgi:hypothetical protein